MEGDENCGWGGEGYGKAIFVGAGGVRGMNFWVVVVGGRGGADFAFLGGWECS